MRELMVCIGRLGHTEELRKQLPENQTNLILVEGEEIDMSSTQIRSKIKEGQTETLLESMEKVVVDYLLGIGGDLYLKIQD